MTGSRIKVEILVSEHCNRCVKVVSDFQKLVNENTLDNIEWRAINVLEELDYAVQLAHICYKWKNYIFFKTNKKTIDGRFNR